MPRIEPRFLRVVSIVALTAFGLTSASPAFAAQQPPRPALPAMQQGSIQTSQVVVVREQDARGTLSALNALMRRYPPSLGHVLKLDPSLLTNQAYLAPYPELAQFLAQHPEVAHNPSYYLQYVDVSGDRSEPQSPESAARSETMNMWSRTFESFSIVLIVATVMLTVATLIRILVNHRRWLRSSKIQADAHNKLLDRLASNEELVAYIQSPSGERFLQSAPVTVDADRTISAPLGRILWSVQAGVVLMAGSYGLMRVGGHLRDIGQGVSVLGAVGMWLGVGFVVSAGVSYLLSRSLGLLNPVRPTDSKMSEPPASRHV